MLECQSVINAVTGHRHHMATLLQSNHHVLLLLGRHTTENIVSSRSLSELRTVLRQSRSINRARRSIHTRSLRSCSHSERIITREDLQSHALTVEILHNLRCIRTHILTENDEQNRGSIRRDLLDRLILLIANHRGSMCQNHSAQTQCRQLSGALTFSATLGEKRLRSTQKPRTRILKLNRTKT